MPFSLFRMRPGPAGGVLATGVLTCALLAGGAVATHAQEIAISGSTTLQPVLERIAGKFMKHHPGPRVSVAAGGSGEGITALLRNENDMAASSRFIGPQELELARQGGIYPVPFRVANDCIIPIVHKSNSLRNLQLRDLRKIYLGQISNWKELGGRDREVRVISRTPQSGTFGVWRDLVMATGPVADTAIEMRTSAEVVKAVARDKGAIGYISLGHLSATIKPLRVDGVMGSLGSVADGRYSLSRPLFLFTRGWPDGRALQFINYVLKPDKGQEVVQKMGLIPVHLKNNS